MTSETRPIVIKAEGVTKRFGALVAVDRVDYTLHRNEIACIIGSNGAGKTTFFNLLTGYFRPDAGRIFHEGEDITRMSAQQRVARGLMRTFQLTSTFDNLSVVDNLVLAYFRAYRSSSLVQSLVNLRGRHRQHERIVAALERFQLQHVRQRPVIHLGLGEKRRLEIAMAVLVEPRVLLLDEPLAGLAETEIARLLEVLRMHAGEQTIVIVEHKISHVKELAERLTVMHEGKIIAEGGYEECLQHPEVRRSYWHIDVSSTGSAHGPR